MKYSMPPIIDDACTLLILGSLPGEKSLQLQQYYAHPQNQFWRILCCVLDEQMPENYEQKKQMLLRHHIALWDVVHSAERNHSSLDSQIKNAIPNDIEGFLANHKKIMQIALNGNKACNLFQKHFNQLSIETFCVPSTSPAYASMRIERKIELWRTVVL